jgi:cytochrome c-type protein NapC
MKLKAFLQRYWRILRSPSKYYSIGFLALGGFVMGILFWGAFNTGMELTNTEPFCTSCHQNLHAELQNTIHFTNRSGVRVQASKEVFAWMVGTIDTPEKFEARRRLLAEREWARLSANDSLECRNCHEFEYMDFTWQSTRAVDQHSTALASGEKTCIDCHKGIAHRLPPMEGVEGF